MQGIKIECQNPEHHKLLEEILSLQNKYKELTESKLMSPNNEQNHQNQIAEIEQINRENMRAPNNSRLNYSNSEEKITGSSYLGSSVVIDKNNIRNSKTYPHSILVSPPKSEDNKKTLKNVSFAEDDKVQIYSGKSTISNKNHSNESQNSYKRKIEEMRQSIKEIHNKLEKKEHEKKIDQQKNAQIKKSKKSSAKKDSKNKNLKLDLVDSMNVNISINSFQKTSELSPQNNNISNNMISNIKSISSNEKDKIIKANDESLPKSSLAPNIMEVLKKENATLKSHLNNLKNELSKIFILQNSQINFKDSLNTNIPNKEKINLTEEIEEKKNHRKNHSKKNETMKANKKLIQKILALKSKAQKVYIINHQIQF